MTVTTQLKDRHGALVGYCDVPVQDAADLPQLPEVITLKEATERTFVRDDKAEEHGLPVYVERTFDWASGFRGQPTLKQSKSTLMTFDYALKVMPPVLAEGFDPHRDQTLTDLLRVAEHELNLDSEGEITLKQSDKSHIEDFVAAVKKAIKSQPSESAIRRYMQKNNLTREDATSLAYADKQRGNR